ncbi:hypothetical protein RFI_30896 [Reticulomyxa filosa]|uniref:PITH domain-containing protein n=1 Tax=Reticulomyxa filosa TaxID=46433 RepID=X6LX34_RETFI|nr:hypothetical protein RFI_30896 [Reticulomyxa filosa]|eukprot:ETO06498.1 hypothetical protein RFI_30896 [Reticulomyxa filosa]
MTVDAEKLAAFKQLLEQTANAPLAGKIDEPVDLASHVSAVSISNLKNKAEKSENILTGEKWYEQKKFFKDTVKVKSIAFYANIPPSDKKESTEKTENKKENEDDEDEDEDEDEDVEIHLPKRALLFVNPSHALDFSDVENMTCTQEMPLQKKLISSDAGQEIQTNFVKFQSVSSLSIYIGGQDTTELDEEGRTFLNRIKVKGLKIHGTNMNELKKTEQKQ